MRALEINLECASAQDCRRLWEWANDPVVRRSAFETGTIAWEDHVRWFENRLRDPSTLIFIALDAHRRPLGQVRFQWQGPDVAEIDISLDGASRGSGLGSALIRRSVDTFFASKPVRTVMAHVRPENHASLRAFENAGFESRGLASVNGHQAIRFIINSHD
jgi:RimJ/RimL family protein N-acetyltransferase